jgi:misacylated tRNA(Ala) deacylase
LYPEFTVSTSLIPTRLLCLEDASLRRFAATVVSSDPEAGAVVLDQTAFYPGGGGQPADTGRLLAEDGRAWTVTGMSKAGGAAVHTVEAAAAGDALPQPGDRVTGELDWERRYRLMRTHTALHVLCGVVFHEFGALVTGGNMAPDKARMDFELEEFTPERVAAIERRANEEIAAGHPVRVRVLPREEAFQIPDLLRTKINLLPEGITEVRIVEIVGLDLQADGGTHVANTREVGGIKVVGTRSKGRLNKRLEIVLTGGEGDAA